MDYYTNVESNRFKVKDPKKFRKDFEERIGGDDVDLQVFEDGFQFWATNPYVSNPEYKEGEDGVEECQDYNLDIPDIVQPHLKDGQVLHAIYITRSSKDTQIGCSLCVATNVAIKWDNCDQRLAKMEHELYPRYVTCLSSCHNRETDRWIEKGKRYLALELIKQRNRWYYVIDVKGHEITWGKEYFDGGEG